LGLLDDNGGWAGVDAVFVYDDYLGLSHVSSFQRPSAVEEGAGSAWLRGRGWPKFHGAPPSWRRGRGAFVPSLWQSLRLESAGDTPGRSRLASLHEAS
jgi:hypothetical protein